MSARQAGGADITQTSAEQPTHRVLLVDDHRVLTDVFAAALDAQADLECVAVANTMREGLAKAEVYDFDVAVVDLQLPDGGGLTMIEALKQLRPRSRVIVLTGHPRPDLARQALELGATAFLPKDDALRDVLAVIRGQAPTNPLPGRSRSDDAPSLTPREHEVLALLAGGGDARSIARTMTLSIHTVRDYIKTILAKLGAHSQLDAVVIADRFGLVTIGERFR